MTSPQILSSYRSAETKAACYHQLHTLFYNVDLIGLTNKNKDMVSLGFMDDMAFATRGNTFKEANEKLKWLMEKADRALRWGERYKAEFELEKTALLCLTRTRKQDPNVRGKTTPTPHPSITIHNHQITPQQSCKFLAVILNEELRFKDHAVYTITKGTKHVLACGRMTKTTKGIKGSPMKKLYEVVAISK
jgi:hypothetical protein